MSFSLKTSHHSPTLLVFDEFPKTGISRVSSPFDLSKSKNRSLNQNYCRSFSSISTDNNATGLSDAGNCSPNFEGSAEKTESNREESSSPKEFYVAPAPGRMGYVAAVERFLKVMAMVWAGSQVTKLVRAGGFFFCIFVDKGLSWFTDKFKFKSQGKAFMVIVGFCFGLALMLFFAVTLLSA